MEVTPETAASWWEIVDKGGLPLILLSMLVFVGWIIRQIVKLAPDFLARWKAWTEAVDGLNDKLDWIKRWCEQHNGNTR